MHDSVSEQSTGVEGSVASNVTVTIENRTKNSSPDSAPAVVVEGETDSDDTCEEGGSCDESHDSNQLLIVMRLCWRRVVTLSPYPPCLSSGYWLTYTGGGEVRHPSHHNYIII